MEMLLSAALSNALIAGLLAVPIALASSLCRRPAVRHALWLLVLLKLVTPPLFSVPVPWPVRAEPSAPSETVIVLPEEPADLPVAGDFLPAETSPAAPPPAETESPLAHAPEPPTEEPAADPGPAEPPPANVAEPAVNPFPWKEGAVGVWMVGSILWLGLALFRTRQFIRLLRHGRLAPKGLQGETARLAQTIGLRAAPSVWLFPGRLPPMLWAVGTGPRLLVPAGLLDRLDKVQRQALLVHELAHLKRRDHWVRLFELLVTVLFWWHPVVWWARRELRLAEEQCCDAWVVWALPGAARVYALTLVETVDFLSESWMAEPSLASGLGPVR